MLDSIARRSTLVSLSGVGLRTAFASLLLLAGAGSVHDATASNETRTLSFHHTHSEEDLTVTFKRNGRYDEDALKSLNHFLRDWRSQDQTTMDRRLFDILWEVNRDVGGKQPIQIISSYRAPATNAMLRRRSSGVARSSLHTRGQAMDFFIPNVALADIRAAGLRLQRGGVGFYPTSGSPFVHLDTGSVRHWPRMSHDQLAKLFPDGRTVLIPSDGKPLPGYELALADIQRRKNGDDANSSKKSFLASLFGKKSNDDDDEAGDVAESPAPETKTAAARTELTPIPRARPAGASQQATYQVASAAAVEAPAPTARSVARDRRADAAPASRPLTPADIINARGFWGDDPAPVQPQPATTARRAIAAVAEPQSTASLPASADEAPASAANALAYAPAALVDRSQIVASTGPVARQRAAAPSRTNSSDAPQAATAKVASVGPVVGPWLKAMMLSPSATTSMAATAFGQSDLRAVRPLLVRPERAVAMTFSDDPQMGMTSDRFSGPAVASLPMVSFLTRTASLR